MVENKIDISNLVNQPHKIDESSINKITDLSREYPWCSSYQIILAKGYANQESYLQSKQLRIASTYAGSREQLFLYFHKNQEQNLQIASSKEESTQKKSEEKTSSLPTPSPQKKISKLAEKKTNKKGSKEKRQSIDFDKVVKYNPIEELKPIEPKIKPDKVHIPIEQIPYNPEKELAKLIDDSSDKHEKDFMYWINNIDKISDNGSEVKKKTSKKRSKKENSPDHVQNLLDQFLSTKRSRPIQNRSFYNAQDKAEESETDKMNIVSETLLNIYVKQGHLNKAILGYEKLSLQNPDKSAYFAARIKEIKQTQNES